MSEVIVVRSPQEFLAELKKLADAKVAAPPLTGAQLEEKISALSLALESTTLAPEMRKQIEAAREDLIRQQFVSVHGFLPDSEGNRPVDEAAIVETVTKSVIESLTVAPESKSCGSFTHDDMDIDEQAEALNEIDEADTAAASEIPAKIPTPRVSLQLPPQAVVLSPETVAVLRAALRANLMHVVSKVLTILLQGE